MSLVLASASPRRRELLTQAGYTFTVHPAHIPEDPLPNENPIAYVVRLARQKAEAVFAEITKAYASERVGSNEPHGAQALSAPPQVGAPDPLLTSNLGAPGPGSPQTGLRLWGGGLASETWEGSRPNKEPLRGLTVLGADTTVVIDNQILEKPIDAADAARMLRLLSGRTHRVITGVAVVTAHHTEVAAEVTGVRFLTLSEEEITAYIATGEPMDKAGAYAIQGYAARWIPRIVGDYFNVVGLPLALVSTMLDAARINSDSSSS